MVTSWRIDRASACTDCSHGHGRGAAFEAAEGHELTIDPLDWSAQAGGFGEASCQRLGVDLELLQTSRIDRLIGLLAIQARRPARRIVPNERQLSDAIEPPALAQDATGLQEFDQPRIGAVEIDPVEIPDRSPITLLQQRAQQRVGGRGQCGADAP